MRRSKYEIIRDILDVCVKPTVKSRVIGHVGACYTRAEKYLVLLEHVGLIEVSQHGKKKLVKTTKKGLDVLKSLNYIIETLGSQ